MSYCAGGKIGLRCSFTRVRFITKGEAGGVQTLPVRDRGHCHYREIDRLKSARTSVLDIYPLDTTSPQVIGKDQLPLILPPRHPLTNILQRPPRPLKVLHL